eukprot:scaffold271278_cov30-Tisochrysis_lutea.AAC.5
MLQNSHDYDAWARVQDSSTARLTAAPRASSSSSSESTDCVVISHSCARDGEVEMGSWRSGSTRPESVLAKGSWKGRRSTDPEGDGVPPSTLWLGGGVRKGLD